MADDTAQAVTCLDLNVSGGALDGKNVAGQIDAALKVLTPLLPENQVTLLQRQAEIAREHHTDLGPITKRAHPLRELRGSSPIYTTLSFHLFQDFLALTAPPLVYLAQQAALLRFLGYGDQHIKAREQKQWPDIDNKLYCQRDCRDILFLIDKQRDQGFAGR